MLQDKEDTREDSTYLLEPTMFLHYTYIDFFSLTGISSLKNYPTHNSPPTENWIEVFI